MPLDRRAVRCDHFALGNLHALTGEREEFKLAALGALHERADDDGVIRGESE
jgi:hypothetical protein